MQQTMLNFKKAPTAVEKAQHQQIKDRTEKIDLLTIEIEEIPNWDKFKTLVINTYQEDGDRILYHVLQSPL